MKKKYDCPEIDTALLFNVDVLTASSDQFIVWKDDWNKGVGL